MVHEVVFMLEHKSLTFCYGSCTEESSMKREIAKSFLVYMYMYVYVYV